MDDNKFIITSNDTKEKFFFIIYPIIIWLSLFPIIALSMIFFRFFFYTFYIFFPVLLLIILPLLMLFYYVLFILNLVFICKLLLILVNLLHKPHEGIFRREFHDRDFFFYCLRKSIKKLLFSVYNYFPLPWAKILAFKLSNIKIPSSTGVLDSYIDSDFIEFGKDTILGEGSIVMSSMIIGDYLLIKKVIIKDGSTIGAYSIISPGTIVENGAILGMGSYTEINQHLEGGWIYIGRPAKKLKKVNSNDSNFK